MFFSIQLGHPKIQFTSSEEIREVRNGFSLFHSKEESIYIYINQIPLRLRYREDLYANFDQLLAMVWLVQKEEIGGTKIDLMTQTLLIHWELFWEEDDLFLKGKYRDTEELFAPYAAALNRFPEVKMKKSAFLSEWKTLFHQLIIAFKKGGIEIEDGKERRKFELLEKVEKKIDGYGILYTK